ncbi:hypothetical protein [Crossiella cryophila]|uniref:Uncharacterized protein n=1 Tax=Crossiella cryophila TaxID=43355 RepID=A0A7W7CAV3_9PSEU|nr:hypothetical protein [Crossiella cryophila]MBB4677755.1 hypothetical protein [Crossiella cryophila]
MDGMTLADRIHQLLLELAGRIDDDAVLAAREHAALLEYERAAELMLGALLAGRISITPAEQYRLRHVLDEVRIDPALADQVVVSEVRLGDGHRFNSGNDPIPGLERVLAGVLRRLPALRSVWGTWRTTPAGAAAGAVPHQVLLMEVGPEGFPSAVVYQLNRAMQQAGVRSSIEVFRTGEELPEYHEKALATARRIDVPGYEAEPIRERPVARRARSEPPPPPPAPSPDVTQIVVTPDPPALADTELSPVPPPMIRPDEDPVATTTIHAMDPIPADPDLDAPLSTPAMADLPLPSASEPATSSAEAKLTDRERGLLRQLHQELAEREQKPKATKPGPWQVAGPTPMEITGPNGFGQANGHPKLGH